MKSVLRHDKGSGFTQCKSVKSMDRILVNTLMKPIESGKAVTFNRQAVLWSKTSMHAGVFD